MMNEALSKILKQTKETPEADIWLKEDTFNRLTAGPSAVRLIENVLRIGTGEYTICISLKSDLYASLDDGSKVKTSARVTKIWKDQMIYEEKEHKECKIV